MENHICKNHETCIMDWDKIRGFYEKEGQFKTSLTHLNGLKGTYSPNGVYGSEFMHVEDMHTPYYDRMTTETVKVPWQAEFQERTFMNRTKELNQRPFNTYQYIKTAPVSQEIHEQVPVEGFGENTQNLMFKVICIIILIYFIYRIINEMK